MTGARSDSLRSLLGKVAAVVAGCVLGLIVAEVGLRVAGIAYPTFNVSDEHAGYALRPNAHGYWRNEGASEVRINSAGMRDVEHTPEKPSNVLRIAVLGDSYAEAFQVPIEEAFWAVMARRLETCGGVAGKSVEALNFGVGGYNTGQQLVTLRTRAWAYDPDIVLLAFLTSNDIADNSRFFNSDPLTPYSYVDGDRVVVDTSFVQSSAYQARQRWYAQLAYRLIDRSRVLQLVNEAKNSVRRRSALRDSRADAGGAALQEVGLTTGQYSEPADSAWADAWRVTEGLLAVMSEETAARGRRFVVVTLSDPMQVHPDASLRAEFMASIGVEDLFYPDRRIKAAGAALGVPVIELAPSFQALADSTGIYLHGFANTILGQGHWNADGHRLAGEIIAREVCALLEA